MSRNHYMLSILLLFSLVLGCTPTSNKPRPEIKLRKSENKYLTESDLDGYVKVIFFGFTGCQTICPTTLARLANILSKLDTNKKQTIKLVFITIDPERDGFAQLNDYIKNFNFPILALTGSLKEIETIAKNFHVDFQIIDIDTKKYTFVHSTKVFLLDQKGFLNKIFKNDVSEKEFLDHIQSMLK